MKAASTNIEQSDSATLLTFLRGTDVVKAIMVGADVAMMTSAVLHHGPGHFHIVERELEAWLDDIGTRLAAGESFPAPVAAVTFDDGYQDVWEHAFGFSLYEIPKPDQETEPVPTPVAEPGTGG